jgi:hypothetical protein
MRAEKNTRYSEWRVWKRLDYKAQAICKIHGHTPSDLVELALDSYIAKIVADWYNIETYAVVMEIRSNPDWEEVAYEADDYNEWCGMMVRRGITETRSGISIRDKKIARRRVDPEIRKRNNYEKDYSMDEIEDKRPHRVSYDGDGQ